MGDAGYVYVWQVLVQNLQVVLELCSATLQDANKVPLALNPLTLTMNPVTLKVALTLNPVTLNPVTPTLIAANNVAPLSHNVD